MADGRLRPYFFRPFEPIDVAGNGCCDESVSEEECKPIEGISTAKADDSEQRPIPSQRRNSRGERTERRGVRLVG